MNREDITIPSGGTTLAAWLYRPDGDGPHPAVVLAHGFGAPKAARLDRYAERFTEAGFAALVFDYRHFGDSGGEPRQLLSVNRQLEDWRAAVAYARDHEDIEAERVALWGTSFAGGHVIEVAADDPSIAAVVSQVPFADGLRTALRLPFLSSLKVTFAALLDLVRSAFGGEPVRIPLVGPPGSLAAMATPDAESGYRRLFEAVDCREDVLARIGLRVPTYRPVTSAGDVRCPLLVQAGEDDDLTPASAAERIAERAPRGRFSLLPTGHFEPYFEPWFDEVVDEQVAFLREHV